MIVYMKARNQGLTGMEKVVRPSGDANDEANFGRWL